MVPPWDDTMPWQTDNPRPVPEPIGLVVKNGSNIWGRKASGTPGPLSATSIRTARPDPPWTDVVSHNPGADGSDGDCEFRPLLGDEQSPRHLDRLLGVDDEVHEHLVQLVLVRHDRRQVGRIGTRDLDAGAPQAVGQDLDAAVENRPDIHRLDLAGFLPGQGEEAPDDPGAALGGRPQPGQRVPDSRIFTPLLEHDGAPEHDRERIVQFMRHAGQERAERRQLLALVHRRALPVGFGLGLLPVADVEDEAGDVGESRPASSRIGKRMTRRQT